MEERSRFEVLRSKRYTALGLKLQLVNETPACERLDFPAQSLWKMMEGKSFYTTTAESSGGEDEGGGKKWKQSNSF